jgi:hypothetical protein
LRRAGKQAKPCHPDTGTRIEHPVSGLRGNSRLQPDGVAPSAVPSLWLRHGDAAAEEVVERRSRRLISIRFCLQRGHGAV